MLTIISEHFPEAGRIKDGTNWSQGRWGFLTYDTSGNTRWEVVDSYADAQKNIGLLAPIHKPPIQKDQSDDDYETVYSEDNASYDGKFPSFIRERHSKIEDTKLSDRVDADFTATTAPGTLMVLTVSGYPTLDGASDDPGSSATVVGVFEEWTGGSVVYERF